MMKMLNNLSIKARLYLAVTFFLITLFVSMYNAYLAIGANIDFAAKEKLGNMYQRPVALMLHDASKIRALLQLGANSSEYSQVSGLVGAVSKQMEYLKTIQDQIGADLQFTKEGLESRKRSHLDLTKVSGKWDGLKSALSSSSLSSSVSENLVSFIADLRGLIAHSGDTSNLILDPDLDSYYLMDVTLLAMPQTIDRMGSIAERFYTVLKGDYSGDKASMVEAAVSSRLLAESDIARVVADMDVSFTEDPNFYGVSADYKSSITPAYQAYQEKSAKLSELLKSIGDGNVVSLAEFSGVLHDALEASSAFLAKGYDNLDVLLETRIQSYKDQQMKALAMSFAGCVLSMIFYIFVAYSISRPLQHINTVMVRLSENDFSAEIPYADSKSEIGRMSSSIQVFKHNGQEAIRLKEEQQRIERQAEEDKRDMLNRLAEKFESHIGGSIQSLNDAVEKLKGVSHSMEGNAVQTQEASTTVAAASEQTSANVSTVAAATEEMTASAQEIAVQVSNVATKAGEASQFARQTSAQFNQLNDLVGNIGEVVTAIKDIAEQTNLLALNATIEAARAGDAGKGFAVVADEVKKLATETGKKTEEIEKRISMIQQAAQGSVNAMIAIINNVSDIDGMSSSAAAAIEEQNATICEISRNISEVSMAAQDVTGIIHNVQSGVAETGQSIELLRGAADHIMSLSAGLDKAVSSFLSQIRSSTE